MYIKKKNTHTKVWKKPHIQMYEKITHTIVWKKNHAYKGMGKKDPYKCMKKNMNSKV